MLETVARPNEWMKKTVRERKEVQRQARQEWGWDLYASETEHAPEKLQIVQALDEKMEQATDWKPTRSKNQINFRHDGQKIVGIQFWSQKARLVAFQVTNVPPADPYPEAAGSGLRDDGSWFWDIRSLDEVPKDLSPLVQMVYSPLDE